MFSAIPYAVDDVDDYSISLNIWHQGDNVCQHIGTISRAESGVSRYCSLTTCIQQFVPVVHRQGFDSHSERFSFTLRHSPTHLMSRLPSSAYLMSQILGQRTEDAQAQYKHLHHWAGPPCQRSTTYLNRPRQRKNKSKPILDIHVSRKYRINEANQDLQRSNRSNRQHYTRRPGDQNTANDHKTNPSRHEHHRNLSNLHTVCPTHAFQPAQRETQLSTPPAGPFMSGALNARDQRPGQLPVNLFRDRLGRWHERHPADAGRNTSTTERAATEKSLRANQRVSDDGDIEEILRPEMSMRRHRKRPLKPRFVDEVTLVLFDEER